MKKSKKDLRGTVVLVSKLKEMKAALQSARSTINALQNGGDYKHTFKQTLKMIDNALA